MRRLYWRVVEFLGSKREADALSMQDVEELAEHWQDEPPVAACVRAYLGVKPRPTKAKAEPVAEISEAEWERLKRAALADEAMHGRTGG